MTPCVVSSSMKSCESVKTFSEMKFSRFQTIFRYCTISGLMEEQLVTGRLWVQSHNLHRGQRLSCRTPFNTLCLVVIM